MFKDGDLALDSWLGLKFCADILFDRGLSSCQLY